MHALRLDWVGPMPDQPAKLHPFLFLERSLMKTLPSQLPPKSKTRKRFRCERRRGKMMEKFKSIVLIGAGAAFGSLATFALIKLLSR